MLVRNLINILFFFLLSGSDLCNEICEIKQSDNETKYHIAVKYFENSKFREALELFKFLYDSTNSNLNYLVGLCYLNINGEETKALPYLQKSIEEIDSNYSIKNYSVKVAPPISWVYLGDAYHREKLYKEASYAYHQYRSYLREKNQEELKMINQRIRGLGLSYETRRTHGVEIINMGKNINSRFSDYNPVLSGDQKTMVYTSYRSDKDHIFISKKDSSGFWSKPLEITEIIGSRGNCFTSSLAYNGEMLLLICTSDIDSDIYYCLHNEDGWTKMKVIEGAVNTEYYETSACISFNNKQLYFSSDRPGGIGGFDLYRAEFNNGKWRNIENLGPNINTKLNEDSPFITADNQSLYFSSNGHETIGKMDILVSSRAENGSWNRPKNLGQPFNTIDDDMFYLKIGEQGYVMRDQRGGEGKNDLYIILLNEIDESENLNESEERNNDSEGNYPLLTKEQNDFIITTEEEIVHDEMMENFKSEYNSELRTAIYTIQIYALTQYKEPHEIKDFKNVKVSRGADNFYRYTVGEYSSYEEAEKYLLKIRQAGYKKAYIRKINEISNYYLIND